MILKRYARNGIVSGIMIVQLCMRYITKPKTGEDERCCCCHQVYFSQPFSAHRYNTQHSMSAQPRIITKHQLHINNNIIINDN